MAAFPEVALFTRRTSADAEVALILLDKVHWLIPVCFDDIWSEYHADV